MVSGAQPNFIKYNRVYEDNWPTICQYMKRARRWQKYGFYLHVEEHLSHPNNISPIYRVTLYGPNQKKFGPLMRMSKEIRLYLKSLAQDNF